MSIGAKNEIGVKAQSGIGLSPEGNLSRKP